MQPIMIKDKRVHQDVFNLYEKIVTNLDKSCVEIVKIQNNKSLIEFKKNIGHAVANISKVYEKLNNIQTAGQAILFRKELSRFKELISKLKSLDEDMELPYMLYVIGMGKAGKSTLLNSLVGLNVADVGTLPKTWKTDLFYKLEHAGNDLNNKLVEIHFRNGEIGYYSEIDAKSLIISEEEKRKNSEKIISTKFREMSTDIDSIDDKEVLREELKKEFLYRSEVREARWPVPNVSEDSVLNHFSLIDTPGLSQYHQGVYGESGVKGEDIGDFYHKADGVIWVLDATTISASKPKEALKNLEDALSYTCAGSKKINNIVAVLNHSDKVLVQGGESALTKVVEEAKKIFGNQFLEITPYSAKQANEALQKNDHNLLEVSGYNRLCKIINQYFYFNALNLRIHSKKQGFLGEITTYQKIFLSDYLQRLYADFNNLNDGLTSAKERLKDLSLQIIGEWELEINEHTRTVKKNIQLYTGVLARLEGEVQVKYVKDKIFDLKKLRSVQESFYSDSLKKVSDAFKIYQKHYTKIFAEYKYIKSNEFKVVDVGKISDDTAISLSGLDSIWDSESMLWGGGAALLGMAVLGPAGVLAGLFGYMLGKDSEKQKIYRLKKKMIHNLLDIERNSIQDVRQFVADLFEKNFQILEDNARSAFCSLHAVPERTEYVKELFEQIDSMKSIEFNKLSLAYFLFKGLNHDLTEMH